MSIKAKDERGHMNFIRSIIVQKRGIVHVYSKLFPIRMLISKHRRIGIDVFLNILNF